MRRRKSASTERPSSLPALEEVPAKRGKGARDALRWSRPPALRAICPRWGATGFTHCGGLHLKSLFQWGEGGARALVRELESREAGRRGVRGPQPNPSPSHACGAGVGVLSRCATGCTEAGIGRLRGRNPLEPPTRPAAVLPPKGGETRSRATQFSSPTGGSTGKAGDGGSSGVQFRGNLTSVHPVARWERRFLAVRRSVNPVGWAERAHFRLAFKARR